MKRLDLEPTKANILACIKNDTVSRQTDIKRLISLLDEIEPPFSICVDAPWGDGKTIFVKSAQMVLESRNPNLDTGVMEHTLSDVIDENNMKTEISEFLPVYFNAWKNDMLDNPLGSVIASIAADCNMDWGISSDGALQRAAALIDLIGGLLGCNLNTSIFLEGLSGSRLIEEYQKRRELENEISDFINSILAEKAEKLVLFIDELDRCKPEYAIRLLSDIKCLFENERVIVVYSADLEQLANALEGFYGGSFSTQKYLERFYDRRFEMTPVRKKCYLKGSTLLQYDEYRFDSIVNELLQAVPGTMRDINRLKMSICDAESFAKRSRSVNVDFGIAFVESGLLPVFLFLENTYPAVWQKVRSAQSFEGVYEFGAKSSAFIDFLDSAIDATYSNAEEIDDDKRKNYVVNLCSLIFIESDSTDKRRAKAHEELGRKFWGTMDVGALRSLDFRRYRPS